MTESRIFEILTRLNPEINPENPIDEHTKLIPSKIEVISRSLANLLYSTNKEGNISSINKRNHTINFIRYLCKKEVNHFTITEDNYVSILSSVLKEDSEGGEEKERGNDTIIEGVRTFYEDEDRKSMRKYDRHKFIIETTKRRLNDAEFSVPKNLLNLRDFDESFFELTKTTIDEYKRKRHDPVGVEKAGFDPVKLVYSLLNMERTPRNVDLIKIALKKITAKTIGEVQLIKYAWGNLGGEHKFLLEKFPFVYEEILIGYTKKLIQENVGIEEFLDEHPDLCKCLSVDPELKQSSLGVLYELYSLSNYNSNILKFISFFNLKF